MSNQQLPIIGETYNYFDDGKISEQRRIPVIITEIISFNKADEELIDYWKENTDNYGEPHWIYAESTDYFIKGKLLDDGIEKVEIVFVRTIDKDWCSLGWWLGILDIDGSLNKLLINYMNGR